MIKHSFKLIWNQKTKKFYIILELFILFIILLVGSVYLIQKYELYTGGVGANIEDVFYLRVSDKNFDKSNFKTPLRKIKKELEALPEIKTVSYSHFSIPYIWSMNSNYIKFDTLGVSTVIRKVDEDFGKVFNVNILAGKWFKDDYTGTNSPILIDIQVAKKLFGSAENAINKIVNFEDKKVVIGVYDMFKRNEYETNFPSSFLPIDQKNRSYIDIVIKYKPKANINSYQLSLIINKYFDNKQFIISDASTVSLKKENILEDKHMEILALCVFMIFLIINIILGMIGIFGYSVKQRRAELGIRRALGSSAKKLHFLLLCESWSLTILALVPAIFIALQIQILELLPVEMELFLKALALSVMLIFSLVSLCVYYPAFMATKINPAVALKDE